MAGRATSLVEVSRVALSWSGGKESALALRALREEAQIEPVDLLTTPLRLDGGGGMAAWSATPAGANTRSSG